MLDVVIVGSGFSGLCMGIELKKNGFDDFIIIEKANTLGGTWRDNTYPGAECDVPSALYSYSFEPNPNWNYKWSHQKQILKYLKYCAGKYELLQHIVYDFEVNEMVFDEELHGWNITSKEGNKYIARTVVSAIGQLHHPRYPDIPNIESFNGPCWHSAGWDHAVELKDKNIGVIGNAASAVQFIPEIAPKAKYLYIFQRSANWMLPKPDRAYYNWEKNLRKLIPALLKIERLRLWLTGGVLFLLMGQNKFWKKLGQNRSLRYMKSVIKNPVLRNKLIPSYPIGAKRILFSDKYYQALNLPNVELITDPVMAICPEGVDLGSRKVKLDVLIMATGFITHPFLKDISIIGRKGETLSKMWKEGEKTYLGISTHGFPNFFMIYGPNTNLGHNSIVIMSECQAKYILQCLIEMKHRDATAMEIKLSQMEKFEVEMQDRLKKSAWNMVETSWYKSKGRITNNWPGRTWEYMHRTRNVRFDHYSFA